MHMCVYACRYVYGCAHIHIYFLVPVILLQTNLAGWRKWTPATIAGLEKSSQTFNSQWWFWHKWAEGQTCNGVDYNTARNALVNTYCG